MTTELFNDTEKSTKKVSPVNIAFKWAVIGMLLSIIQVMTLLYMNDNKYNPQGGGWVSFLVGLVVLFTVFIMPIKEYRDKELGGYISFGKAFKTGFITTLFMVGLTVLFYIVFYNFVIDWDAYVGEEMERGVQKMKESGMSDTDIQKRMADTPAFMSAQGFWLGVTAIAGLFFDTIVVLISAAIMKKEPPRN